MRAIVSSKHFGKWLRDKVTFASKETVYVSYKDCKMIIANNLDDEYQFECEGQALSNDTDCSLNYSQISKLEKFLLLLPEQPITITFEFDEIICSHFKATF